jgi:hypothetical protein
MDLLALGATTLDFVIKLKTEGEIGSGRGKVMDADEDNSR